MGVQLLEGIAAFFQVLLLPLHEPDEEMRSVVMLRQLPCEVRRRRR